MGQYNIVFVVKKNSSSLTNLLTSLAFNGQRPATFLSLGVKVDLAVKSSGGLIPSSLAISSYF